MSRPKAFSHFGIVGLTEDSKSILLKMHDLGYIGCVYDFAYDNVKAFLENEAKNTKIIGAESLKGMIGILTTPRCIMLTVEDFIGVGLSIDGFIEIEMLPHMTYQDYVLDAGSSGREDSQTRIRSLMAKGIRYVAIKDGASVALLQGICISLENNRVWNSYEIQIRPSTHEQCKQMVVPDIQKVVPAVEGKICCNWGRSGKQQYYIELIINRMSNHNNRAIREAEGLMSKIAQLKEKQVRSVFREWCKGDLNSLFCKCKTMGARSYTEPASLDEGQRNFVDHLVKALLACQVINFARGFASIREVAEIHQWNIDYAELSPAWPKNYHFKCAFYRKIKGAFTKNPQLSNLLLDENFAKVVNEGLPSIKEVISKATDLLKTVQKLSINLHNFSFEEFSDALEYYEDFTTNKPLCARLFELQFENEESAEKLDLSSLYKYQYQLRGLQSAIEKIEKTVKEVNEETENSGRDKQWAFNLDYKYGPVQEKIVELHDSSKPVYEACMQHLEKDEGVTPLHLNILSKRIKNAKDISKMYLPISRERMTFKRHLDDYS